VDGLDHHRQIRSFRKRQEKIVPLSHATELFRVYENWESQAGRGSMKECMMDR
jgi:hypothetical protein